MRLFIAIELEQETKEYLSMIQSEIKEKMSKEDKLKFASKEQIHLTLKFLYEVPQDKSEKIKELLGEIEFKPFSSSLNGFGFFPTEKYIRVVWVGLSPEGKIIALQESIEEKLKKLFKKEKDFRPHLTLARASCIKDSLSFINKLKGIKIENKAIAIDSFKLMKSTLTPNGPIYDELQSFS